MIFASAGHRGPYNRLMRILDGWAATHDARLFAQIGRAGYRPRRFRSTFMLTPAELDSTLAQTSLIVADTNIELLIAAIEREIPMMVLPRQSIFGEDVGEVQSALAERIGRIPGIVVAEDEADLIGHLDQFVQQHAMPVKPTAPDRHGFVSSILGGNAP